MNTHEKGGAHRYERKGLNGAIEKKASVAKLLAFSESPSFIPSITFYHTEIIQSFCQHTHLPSTHSILHVMLNMPRDISDNNHSLQYHR